MQTATLIVLKKLGGRKRGTQNVVCMNEEKKVDLCSYGEENVENDGGREQKFRCGHG